MNDLLPYKLRSTSNRMDSFIFISVFVLMILFFLLTLWWFNKGPIDRIAEQQGSPFTLEDKMQRDQQWHVSSPDSIKQGKNLFDVLVLGDLKPIFDLIRQGEYGSTEVELYRVLTYGLPGTIFRRWDYLPQIVRWQIVHYIRSEMSTPQKATTSEWEALRKEGI